MEFSNELIKTLLQKNITITIEGVNYLGQEFKTTGTPLGRGYIDTDSLGVYLGQRNPKNFNYLTFFGTYQGDGRHCMYINTITNSNGDVIYSNQDIEEIKVSTKNYASAMFAKSSMTVENTDLENYIAKPVIIGTTQTTIKSVRKSPNGEYTLECSDGTMSSIATIKNVNALKIDSQAISKFSQEDQSEV